MAPRYPISVKISEDARTALDKLKACPDEPYGYLIDKAIIAYAATQVKHESMIGREQRDMARRLLAALRKNNNLPNLPGVV